MANIEVKNLGVLNLDATLQEIATAVMHRWGLLVITSAHRPGDPGVHGEMPVRGLDLRCGHEVLGDEAEKWANERWVYDTERPWLGVALYHDVGQGPHLHLQSHPNTVKREA